MRIKSFIAPTVHEALAAVKRDMGDSSIILETRNIEEGDMKSESGQDLVEVVAAENNYGRSTDQDNAQAQGKDQEPDQDQHQDAQSDNNDALDLNLSDRCQPHFSQPEQQPTEECPHVPDLVESVRANRPDSQMINKILTDHSLLDDIPEMADYSTDKQPTPLVLQQDSNLSDNWPEKSKELYKQLRAQQVEKEHARILINEILCKVSRDESETLELQRLMVQKSITNKIKISTSNLNDHETCKEMAFIGASGTGKTTTILKLASELKKRSDKNILLISIQGHSADKLHRHAKLIGATQRTATSHQELGRFRDEFGGTSHILIDTPGISHLDNNAILNLKEYTDEMPNLETQLVASATTRYADIMGLVNNFTASSIHRLLFTRVDETDLYGTLFSVAMETQIPLSYITEGKEIPEDIRPVTAEMISEMVMRT